MNLVRSLGKRHYEIAKLWTPTGGAFLGSAVGIFFYLTDWKAVLKFVPIYGGKFDHEPPK